jgi:hypothetical protein
LSNKRYAALSAEVAQRVGRAGAQWQQGRGAAFAGDDHPVADREEEHLLLGTDLSGEHLALLPPDGFAWLNGADIWPPSPVTTAYA